MGEHSDKTGSVAQAIYHISASILFLSMTVLIIFGALQIRQSAGVVSSYLAELSTLQKESQKANVLSPTDANAIATESITNISAKSERWGKIARACNDFILRERRRR